MKLSKRDTTGGKTVNSGQDTRQSYPARQSLGFQGPQARGGSNYQSMADDFASQNLYSAMGTVQRFPKLDEESQEYLDSDYPLLRLIKGEDFEYSQFQIKGTETIVYFEHGEGYYSDVKLTQKVDMSAYIGGARPGILNAKGQSYDYDESVPTHGLLTISSASKILDAFMEQDPKHKIVDEKKVNSLLEEFRQRRTVYPIQLLENPPQGGLMQLVQGRHRIIASIRAGFKYIPYQFVD